jgi:hypothetical protein
MDDEDEDQVEEPRVLAAARLDWTDAPIIVFGLVADILGAFSQAAVTAQTVLSMHYNWRASRQRFRADIDRDIDALTRGDQ